ncbi:hypothetical protein AAD018_006535 [Aestuariibius insulae]|uniref:hypothetical protein n=1 Tax=Aestuariibius insulae TaxID=2058287 RepID=UPI00345E323D
MDGLNLLVSVLEERGYPVEWRDMSGDIERLAKSDRRHLHVVVDDAPLCGPNILYCGPSYLRGFWYVDPVGIRNSSSMQTKPFRPEEMSQSFADTFTARLRSTFIDGNLSKFDQDLVTGFAPERESICLFLQRFKTPKYYPHYMSYPELIEGVIANRGGRRVYIKPHPRQKEKDLEIVQSYHDPDNGVEVTTHSIHGLLAEAAVAVSLSSAVLLEAQMHRVPGIVGAQVDFHHNMVVVRNPAGIRDALDRALAGTFHYEKYLAFFFAQGMVQPRLRQKAAERMKQILTEMGFGGASV